ncbi:MAG TPA: carboxypeptidase-like regulatory domain-containing protein, partial [Flavisolibacter sp.]|nr:carboxypeptidase-like regulatory domain-containing protein [Flavisolibacter sp.]
MTAMAQKATITGKVSGPDGNPLQGVTVTIKGTKTATSTDKDGNYTIVVPGKELALVFSSVGFVERELFPGNGKVLNITLEAKAKAEDEVVVIGYGSAKKK